MRQHIVSFDKARKWYVLAVIVLSVSALAFLSIPKFPICAQDINITSYYQCLDEWENKPMNFEGPGPHSIPGTLWISFKQDVKNSEIKELFLKYNLNDSRFGYPGSEKYFVRFSGNDTDFIAYLMSTGNVTEAVRHHSHPEMDISFRSDLTIAEATEILNNYGKGSIGKISPTRKNVNGLVPVDRQYQFNYLCELYQYDIVRWIGFNSVGEYA